MELTFRKMHGLGNDFVVFDGRRNGLRLSPDQVRAIADRRTGVGCDQLIVLETWDATEADAYMGIYNPDGSESGACGNATRCIASLLMIESGAEQCRIRTLPGVLICRQTVDALIEVDMGPARLDWQQIPLAAPCDTLRIPVGAGPLRDAVGVNMGNPHAVFVTDDMEAVPLAEIGPLLEHDPMFPERANIGVIQKLDDARLRYRVWERGAGITRACGSGACAAGVAAVRRGLTGRRVAVVLDGGMLTIEWRETDGHVLMTGPVATSFTGTLDPGLLT